MEDRKMESNQTEQERENIVRKENRLRELRNTVKHNIHILWIPEGEKENGTENLFKERLDENFPNLGKETGIQSRRHRETRTKSTQGSPEQDTNSN